MEKAGKEGVEIMKANGFATIFLAVILISLYGLDWLWPITDFFSKIFSQLFNGIFSIGWKGFFIVGLYLLFKPKKEKKK